MFGKNEFPPKVLGSFTRETTQKIFELLPLWCNWLSKNGLHIFHPTTLDEFLYDVLLIMCIESRFGLVPLEEVEYRGVISVARKAVVDDTLLELCKSSCLFVDSFNLIGVFGVGVDLPMSVVVEIEHFTKATVGEGLLEV